MMTSPRQARRRMPVDGVFALGLAGIKERTYQPP